MAAEPAPSRWSVLLSRRLWVAGLMGFFGGLPLMLTNSLLQGWLTRQDVSLTAIGFTVGLVGLPYAIKFLWAPLIDRFQPLALGRRRSWLLIAQLSVVGSILLLAVQDPAFSLWPVVIAAYAVTVSSATQDIVIDAYRRESLADSEQGVGASFYVYGYRIGMVVALSGGFLIADVTGYRAAFVTMAAIMALSVVVTLFVAEPVESHKRPGTLAESFINPFVEFFTRGGRLRWEPLLLLVFIIAYKLGDNLGTQLTTAFYIGAGFAEADIAWARGLGTAALLVGVFAGGTVVLRLGIFWSLLVVGVLQALSTACFTILTIVGASDAWLAIIISFEEFTAGMGTSALLAFMAALTDKRFTATQFALLSALANAPRAVLVAPAGLFAELLGWPVYFIVCALIALPSLMLLIYLKSWISESALPASQA